MKKFKLTSSNSNFTHSRTGHRSDTSPYLLREVLDAASQRLSEAGSDTPRLDAEVLLAFALAKDRTWLYVHPTERLNEKQLNLFYELLRRREDRQPVAYITGVKEFFGLEFEVNQHVLIPRPETELLVETALEIAGIHPPQERGAGLPEERRADGSEARVQEFLTVADIGTGSGCIAVTLAKYLPRARFWAIDISPKALTLARQNAVQHNVAGQVTFVWGNLLQPLPSRVNLIVSNPPYISHSELMDQVLQPEVIQYEPRLALDGGEAGLEMIARLIAQAPARLKPGGSLLVEIGAAQGPAAVRLAEAHFPKARIEVKQDLARLDRLLVVQT